MASYDGRRCTRWKCLCRVAEFRGVIWALKALDVEWKGGIIIMVRIGRGIA